MKPKMILALVALITGTAFGSMPAVLPEFKNTKQLAEWRAEMADKANAASSTSDVRSSTLDVHSAFYTGKPYIESTGTYAFKYRSYNPELARWTSEDPSGFPDGANASNYVPVPTKSFDYMGLYSSEEAKSDLTTVFTVINLWETLGYSMAVSNANHSLAMGADRAVPDSHLSALTKSTAFTDQFNKPWFDQYYGSQGVGVYSYQHVVDYGIITDLGNAYGHVGYHFTVQVSNYGSGFKYNVDFSTPNEDYNFNPSSNNPAIAAFSRLQENGYARSFLSSANFTRVYE